MRFPALVLLLILAPLSIADPWRTDPMTPLDEKYMEDSRTQLNDLSRIELGRSFGESRDNDLRLIQTLLNSQNRHRRSNPPAAGNGHRHGRLSAQGTQSQMGHLYRQIRSQSRPRGAL